MPEKLDSFTKAFNYHANELGQTDLTTTNTQTKTWTTGAMKWLTSDHGNFLEGQAAESFGLIAGYIQSEKSLSSTLSPKMLMQQRPVNGEFAFLGVKNSTQLTAYADRYASWPIYYNSVNNQQAVVVSNDPHFVAIALGLTQLSSSASFELLTYDHSLDDKTTIEGVLRLKTGQRITVSFDERETTPKISLSQDFTFEYDHHAERPDPQLVFKALKKGIRNNPLLNNGENIRYGLSGGFDSRLTVIAAADALDSHGASYTLDIADQYELETAALVAKQLGFSNTVIPIDSANYEDLRAGWLLSGGQVSVHAAAGNVVAHRALLNTHPEESHLVTVGAWPGDTLIGSYLPNSWDYQISKLTNFAVSAWVENRGRKWTRSEEGSLSKASQRRVDESEKKLKKIILNSSGRTAAQKISHWAMFSRQPNFSYLDPARLSSKVQAVTPVLYSEYLDELLKLRGEDLLQKRFYQQLIYEASPLLRDVPHAGSRQIPNPNIPRVAFNLSLTDFAMRLPKPVKTFLKKFRPTRARTQPILSKEQQHWLALFPEEAFAKPLQFPDFSLDLSRSSNTQALGNALALIWTEKYLQTAQSTLGTNTSSNI